MVYLIQLVSRFSHRTRVLIASHWRSWKPIVCLQVRLLLVPSETKMATPILFVLRASAFGEFEDSEPLVRINDGRTNLILDLAGLFSTLLY